MHSDAPAKINLYLHLTGKRDDGYHLLDSLSVFITITDRITIEPADEFSLRITGPFAPMIDGEAADTNLVSRATHALAAHLGRPAHVAITLEKNIPPGAGLGGGSSDAAATLKTLIQLWNADIDRDDITAILQSLGSDVPACYDAAPVIMGGVGEILTPAPALPASLPIVVVYPNVPSSTIAAYKNFKGPFTPAANTASADIGNAAGLNTFLHAQRNDLYEAALHSVPVIADVMNALKQTPGHTLARMSGSGSACFAIYENGADADRAVEEISRLYPLWWARRADLWSPH